LIYFFLFFTRAATRQQDFREVSFNRLVFTHFRFPILLLSFLHLLRCVSPLHRSYRKLPVASDQPLRTLRSGVFANKQQEESRVVLPSKKHQFQLHMHLAALTLQRGS